MEKMQKKSCQSLDVTFNLLLEEAQKHPRISIQTILNILMNQGICLVILILSLPFCQPIQIPGFSTPFGLIITFMGFNMIIRNKIWLPHAVLNKKLSSTTLQKMVNHSLKWVTIMKRWIHPRLTSLCHNPIMQIINGLLIILLGILLALPLPIPFSNLLAAWALFFLSLGLLEEDGICVLIGYLVSFSSLIFFGIIFFSLKMIIHRS